MVRGLGNTRRWSLDPLTLVPFEFYLTAREALTNSIPLSGGAADASGFVRLALFGRRGGRPTTWRDIPKVSLVFRRVPASFLASLGSLFSSPQLCPVLRGKLLRGASLFLDPILRRFPRVSPSLSPFIPSPGWLYSRYTSPLALNPKTLRLV